MSAISRESFSATIAGGETDAVFTNENMLGHSITRIFVPESFSGSTLSLYERDADISDQWFPVKLADGSSASWTVSPESFVAVNIALCARTPETLLRSDEEQGADAPATIVVYTAEVS